MQQISISDIQRNLHKLDGIDFVDGYLCALKGEYEVKTFDKKLLKCCS